MNNYKQNDDHDLKFNSRDPSVFAKYLGLAVCCLPIQTQETLFEDSPEYMELW